MRVTRDALLRYIQQVRSAVSKASNLADDDESAFNTTFIALIVDSDTLAVVNAVLKFYDLVDNGICVIEQIFKQREPLPLLDAIYFITPSRESIQALLGDFRTVPHYRSAHVLWSTSITFDHGITAFTDGSKQRGLMGRNGPGEENLPPYDAGTKLQIPTAQWAPSLTNLLGRLQSFVDVNLHYVAFESNAFHIDMPDIIRHIFGQPDVMEMNHITTKPAIPAVVDNLLDICARRLATYLYTQNVQPHFRFKSDGKFNELNRKLTDKTQQYINEVTCNGPPCNVIIVNRAVDLQSLFVHDYHYQALAYDILNIPSGSSKADTSYRCITGSWANLAKLDGLQDDVYTYSAKDGDTKSAVLDESDPVWVKFRHLHFKDALVGLTADMQRFANENLAAKYQSQKGAERSLAELATVIEQMPQYKEMLTKYSLHLHMAQQMQNDIAKFKLATFAVLEQDIALGCDAFGKPVDLTKSMLAMLGQLVTKEQIQIVASTHFMRLILLLVCSYDGLGAKWVQSLFQTVLSLEAKKAVLRFLCLDLIPNFQFGPAQDNTMAQSIKHYHNADKDSMNHYSRMSRNAKYEICRYECELRDVMEKGVANILGAPYVLTNDVSQTGPSNEANITRVKAAHKAWEWTDGDDGAAVGNGSDNQSSNSPHTIVFVLGGMTHAEIRAAAEVSRSSGNRVVIGSTSVLTPLGLHNLMKE